MDETDKNVVFMSVDLPLSADIQSRMMTESINNDDDNRNEAGPSVHKKHHMQVTFQLPIPEDSFACGEGNDNDGWPTERIITDAIETCHTNVEQSQHRVPTPMKKNIITGLKPQPSNDPVQAKRVRCRYCQEFFSEDFNQHCRYAPDSFQSWLECITAMKCARCMMYHCDISDPEDEMPQHPCQCIAGESFFSKRWLGMCILSFILPCLCLYPPCNGCHRIGIRCGCCGQKHRA